MGYSKAKWHKDGWMIMHNSMLNSQSWLIAIKSGVELQSIISTTWRFFQKVHVWFKFMLSIFF